MPLVNPLIVKRPIRTAITTIAPPRICILSERTIVTPYFDVSCFRLAISKTSPGFTRLVSQLDSRHLYP
jgi:hypothetical protein